jgi:hypothetical protein
LPSDRLQEMVGAMAATPGANLAGIHNAIGLARLGRGDLRLRQRSGDAAGAGRVLPALLATLPADDAALIRRGIAPAVGAGARVAGRC